MCHTWSIVVNGHEISCLHCAGLRCNQGDGGLRSECTRAGLTFGGETSQFSACLLLSLHNSEYALFFLLINVEIYLSYFFHLLLPSIALICTCLCLHPTQPLSLLSCFYEL